MVQLMKLVTVQQDLRQLIDSLAIVKLHCTRLARTCDSLQRFMTIGRVQLG